MGVTIRLFRRGDRQAVRRIFAETADRGEPVERFFGNRELAADLTTVYYTDCEPASLWIAEEAGNVVGYLTGCLDSGKCARTMALRVLPRLFLKTLLSGALLRPNIWRIAGRTLRAVVAGAASRRVDEARFPVHFHINIVAGYRGKGIGSSLIERFIRQTREARCRGIHAVVREDNEGMRRLLRRMGFVEVLRRPSLYALSADRRPAMTIILGREVN